MFSNPIQSSRSLIQESQLLEWLLSGIQITTPAYIIPTDALIFFQVFVRKFNCFFSASDAPPSLSDVISLSSQSGVVPVYWAICDGADVNFVSMTDENIPPDLYIKKKGKPSNKTASSSKKDKYAT